MIHAKRKSVNSRQRNLMPMAIFLAATGGLFWLALSWGLVKLNTLRPSMEQLLHFDLTIINGDKFLVQAVILLGGAIFACFSGAMLFSPKGRGGKLAGAAIGLLLADLLFAAGGAYWIISSLDFKF